MANYSNLTRKTANAILDDLIANPDKFAAALDAAFSNTSKVIEARVAAADVNEAKTVSQPVSAHNVISLLGTRGSTLYVSGLSYGTGAGVRDIKKVQFTSDRSKAASFPASVVRDIAGQLARSYTKVTISAR